MADHQIAAKIPTPPTKKYYGTEQTGQEVQSSSYSKPRLSHNTAYTNSSKDFGYKKSQQVKLFKPTSSSGSFAPNGNVAISPRTQSNGNKSIPSFLQNKNNPMKKSIMLAEGGSKTPKVQNGSFNYTGSMGEGAKRAPRLSQHMDMRVSSTDFSQTKQSNKVPLFLQQKNKQSQKKRVPYPSDAERPQSSKQYHPSKSQIMNEHSLTSSYGMKKSKMDHAIISQEVNMLKHPVDPASEWVKKSWSKKKQKKFTINDFQQIKELGSGKYGHVYLVKEKKSNYVCALKIIQKKLLREQQITEQFIRQLKIQTFINHPNIIKMFGFFDDNVNIYIILEVGTGGQLFKQLKKLQSMPEPKVAGIMRQVCQAINELHSNQIIHRDIKPQNIVLHQNIIKLCDFGWSVYCDKNLRTTFCGTPLYVGPQILKGNQYDEKIDIWSLGVMMYEMVVGENPFKITKQEQLIKIVKDDIVIPHYVQLTQQAKSFLFSCLQKNPQQRLSIRQLLNHSFFKKYPDKNDKKVGL